MFLDYKTVDEKTAVKMREILERSVNHYWRRKRIFDIIVALLLIIILIIPALIIATIIWIDDPEGSPIYTQTRIGRHGKEFKMYKFRSMCVNAHNMLDSLADQNEMDGPAFKIKNDPRITGVGKIIRKLSIDELPQFINVLLGDMSIVGPRPALPNEVEQYTDYERLRLLVTPGITCTWQISDNRNDIPFSKWTEMDIEYIKTRTTLGDIMIILKTPAAALRATGR